MLNKKAISPVVATALLIVVAVVAVVGFQGWFGTFSSKIFTNTQTQSDTSVGSTQIETVIGNSVYFDNGGTENITITQVKVEGVDCNITSNATSGMSELDISSCLANVTTTTPEVVIYTDSGIYSEEFYLKTPVSTSNSTTPSAFTGTMVWNVTFPNSSSDGPRGVVVDSLGNIYVHGNNFIGINTDFVTIKYDSSGNEVWNVTVDSGDNDFAGSLDIDSMGNIFVVAYYINHSMLIKYDSNGNMIYNISTNISNGELLDMMIDSNDNIYMSGYNYNGINSDFIILKYNSSGSEILNITYDGGLDDYGNTIFIDVDGNIYIAGESQSGVDYDSVLIKYNSSGSEIWNITYDGGNDDTIESIFVDDLKNVYVTGDLFVGANVDARTVKYNSSGNELWSVIYNGGALSSPSNDILVDSNYNVYIVGHDLNYPTEDGIIIKYDSLGNSIWNTTVESGDTDILFAATFDSQENLYVIGLATISGLNYFKLLKYS